MANDLNQCNFIGRLGQDPDIKYTSTGDAVTNISLAVGWKSKDKEGVEWVRVVAFKKLAEIMGEYLKKGSRVYISGSMRTRKWTDQNQVERYSTEIVANQMQMLDSRTEGGAEVKQQVAEPAKQMDQPQAMDSFEDEIPFN